MRTPLILLAGLLLAVVAWLLFAGPEAAQPEGAPRQRPAAGAEPATGPVIVDDPAAADATTRERAEDSPGRLVFRVRDARGQEPLAAQTLVLAADPADAWETLVLTTDATGRAAAEVPAERALVLNAGDGTTWREQALPIASLEPGESRELIVDLEPAQESFWFRLVSADNGAPLDGATVTGDLMAPGFRAHPDGRIEALGDPDRPRWRVPWIIFDHPEHGPSRQRLRGGGQSAETARRVELARAASLRLTVTRGGQPVTDLAVDVVYADRDGQPLRAGARAFALPASASETWPARTDAAGVFHFPRLPAHEALVYGVRETEQSPLEPHGPEPLRLEPGEERALSWEIGSPQAIQGRALDPDGLPLPDAEVWLLDNGFQHGIEVEEIGLPSWAQSHRVDSTRSDQSGAFQFTEVHPGPYWVALAPRQPDEHSLAKRVRVPPDRSPELIELQADAGAMVSGICLDSSGLPLAGVELAAVGLARRNVIQTESGEDGRFELGPFAAGEEVQIALVFDPAGWRLTAPVTTLAGDGRELQLELIMGATLQGRVLDARTGEPTSAQVTVGALDSSGGMVQTYAGDDGIFDFTGLQPTSWRVFASQTGGWMAVSPPLVLRPGETVDAVELRLSRGGELVLFHEHATTLTIQLSVADGGTFNFLSLEAGERQTCSVPAGPIRLRVFRPGQSEPWFSQDLTVDAGAVVSHQVQPPE